MIHGGKLEFFPLLVALTLGEEEDQTARHLEELKAMVRDVLDRFKAEVRVYVSMWRKGRQGKVQWCTTLCVMDMGKGPLLAAPILTGAKDNIAGQASGTGQVGGAESG